jgi:hypothetical protein
MSEIDQPPTLKKVYVSLSFRGVFYALLVVQKPGEDLFYTYGRLSVDTLMMLRVWRLRSLVEKIEKLN